VLNPQEKMLIKVYKAMSSDEIERRLAAGDLVPLARGVAENELQRRQSRGGRAPNFADTPLMTLAVVVSCGLIIWALLLVLPPLGALVGYGVLFIFACTISKAFPNLGRVLGTALVGASIWATVAYWITPGKGGLEGMLYFFGACIAAWALFGLGMTCFMVARDPASWKGLGSVRR
jgi:hypothetical protein